MLKKSEKKVEKKVEKKEINRDERLCKKKFAV